MISVKYKKKYEKEKLILRKEIEKKRARMKAITAAANAAAANSTLTCAAVPAYLMISAAGQKANT